MSQLRFHASGGDVVWQPGSGAVFLSIPEARQLSLHALEAAEDCRLVDDFAGFDEAIRLFFEANDAIRSAMRWREAARASA